MDGLRARNGRGFGYKKIIRRMKNFSRSLSTKPTSAIPRNWLRVPATALSRDLLRASVHDRSALAALVLVVDTDGARGTLRSDGASEANSSTESLTQHGTSHRSDTTVGSGICAGVQFNLARNRREQFARIAPVGLDPIASASASAKAPRT